MRIILVWILLLISTQIVEAGNRRVFTYFTANYCPSCRVMEVTVYSPEFQTFLKSKNIGFSKVDISDSDGPEAKIAEEYKIESIPQFVIVEVDSNGKTKELVRHSGARLFPFLRKVINDLK